MLTSPTMMLTGKAVLRTTFLLHALCDLLCLAASIPCDNLSPAAEVAYFGTEEIRFPDLSFSSSVQSTQCHWKISAFRKDYVLNLEFSDVNLTIQDFSDVCIEKVTVYDGSEVTDSVLADICGVRSPSFVTSSRETLIVFQSNETRVTTGKFRLRYRAVKERIIDEDPSGIIRIAFGAFIGAVAFVVICSGAIRRFKHGRPNRPVLFFFGRHRIDTSAMPVSGGARTSGGGTRAAPNGQALQDSTGSSSFMNRVFEFFQEIIIKLTPRHPDVESSNSDSSEYSSSLHHSSRSLFRFGGHHHHHHHHNHRPTICADGNAAVDPEFDSHHALPLPELSVDGHESFDYGAIPFTSFTSDPDAVKPPTYEDCVNSVNPLYLHYGGGGRAFYNRAFDLKDEGRGSGTVFTPPPPYSEINRQTQLSSSIAAGGNGTGNPSFQSTCTGDMGYNNRARSNHPAAATGAGSLTPVTLVQSLDTTVEPLLVPEAACCSPDAIEVAEKENKPGIVQPANTMMPEAEKPETEDSVSDEVDSCHARADTNSAPMELLRRSGFISGPHGDVINRPQRMSDPESGSGETGESCPGGLSRAVTPQRAGGSQLSTPTEADPDSPATESDPDSRPALQAGESTNVTSPPHEILLVDDIDPNNSELNA